MNKIIPLKGQFTTGTVIEIAKYKKHNMRNNDIMSLYNSKSQMEKV